MTIGRLFAFEAGYGNNDTLHEAVNRFLDCALRNFALTLGGMVLLLGVLSFLSSLSIQRALRLKLKTLWSILLTCACGAVLLTGMVALAKDNLALVIGVPAALCFAESESSAK